MKAFSSGMRRKPTWLPFTVLLGLTATSLPVPLPVRAEGNDDRGKASKKAEDVTFDDIKFEMPEDGSFDRDMLTSKVESLDGKNIKIRGYILPSFKQSGIKQFVLVRDNMECCYGPGAALYDCIVVEMEPGKDISFTVRPVSVEGKFAVKEFKGPDGKPLAIYRILGKEVR